MKGRERNFAAGTEIWQAGEWTRVRGEGKSGGVLPVLKPVGPTSHDLVARARRWFPGQRVGHLGTLDPAASGLLVLLVGGVTRAARFLDPPDARKVYRVWVQFGASTDSGDSDGVVAVRHAPAPAPEEVETALVGQTGTFWQVPPAHSAVLVHGERAYVRARQGEAVALPPRRVTVDAARLLAWEATSPWGPYGPAALVEYAVRRGTYVRALVRDLGEGLGSGAYVAWLVRTRVGVLGAGEALTWEEAQDSAAEGRIAEGLRDVSALLPDWPEAIAPPDPHGRRVGRGLPAWGLPDGWVRLVAGPARPTWCLARVERERYADVVRLNEGGVL